MRAARAIGATFVCVVLAAACTSDPEAEIDDAIAAQSTSTSSETTSEPAPTSSSSTTSTTDGDANAAAAEAEIERVLIGWWTSPYDSTLGEDQAYFDYLTGIVYQRSADRAEQHTRDGEVRRGEGAGLIDVTAIELDLERGRGTAAACTGSDHSLFDLDTDEAVELGDPNFTFTSEFRLEVTDDGWKISEWLPSFNTGNPIECTVDGG